MDERRKTIFGPYQHGQRWRLVVGFPGGGRVARSFATREEAEAAAREARKKLEAAGPRLLGEALDEYEVHLRTKGNKPRSIATTITHLTRFLGGRAGTVASLTPPRCEALYRRLTTEQAVDTHRNTLAEVKTFARWLVEHGWLKAEPSRAGAGRWPAPPRQEAAPRRRGAAMAGEGARARHGR